MASREIPGTSLPCSLLTHLLLPLPAVKKACLQAAALDLCFLLQPGQSRGGLQGFGDGPVAHLRAQSDG